MLPRLLGLGGGARLRPFAHLERVPTLLPLCMMCTQEGFPAAEMNALCQRLERAHAGVLDCRYACSLATSVFSFFYFLAHPPLLVRACWTAASSTASRTPTLPSPARR